MASHIYEFRLQLMDEIIHADSAIKVFQLVHKAIAVLNERKVHGHIIVRFMDKLIVELDEYRRHVEDVKQECRLESTLMILRNIKRQMTERLN